MQKKEEDNSHMKSVEEKAINTIRLLSADAVQKAKSGHPGLPLGAAPMAYALFAGHMRHNGKNPGWLNRDRFVLSAGHGSALLYSLYHMFGYGITIDDLKNFRQIGSITPGHPERDKTPGVEVSTGPLGQGIANAVGMALAESFIAAKFNKPGFDIIDHHTFVMCGDGCLMQGVSNEAASLAGTLKLGKLILLYDSNDITIEGSTQTAFSENVMGRFAALGWDVRRVDDGNDLAALDKAIAEAKAVKDKPSLIEVKTVIGFGSPNKAGKSAAHGEPLGDEELARTKSYYGYNPKEFFHVPQDVADYMGDIQLNLAKYESDWNNLLNNYKKNYSELHAELLRWYSLELPDLLHDAGFWDIGNGEPVETRTASERIINYIGGIVPNFIGGSADLGPSNKTIMKNREYYSPETPNGANLHFGAREFSMTAIANGMLAHGGVRPYVAEFFVFSDYMKPALRMAALMEIPLIAVLTHDSIGVGEDGPTHQPIEQLAALRSMPGMTVIRPADANETAAAWYLALTRKTSPTALVLTRQKVPSLKETGKGALKGGYTVIGDENETPDIILIATGSEVSLACGAAGILREKGVRARVVSLPSWEIFEEQPKDYKDKVLPPAVKKRLVIEAASSFGWERYAGLDGGMITINSFGKSGQPDVLFKELGFTVENVVIKAMELINGGAKNG